jgi:protein required for attachment to host cells
MNTTWIVVASRDEVRIFSREGKGPLTLINDIGNPLGRAHARDLVTDKAGCSNDNRKPGRPAYSTEESPRDRVLRDFYREVCDHLEHDLDIHLYQHLVLIAEPRLLGIVRELLSPKVKKVITEEISKDLSYENPADILERLWP